MELINKCLSSDVYGDARYEIHKLKECIKNDNKIKADTKVFALSLCDIACKNIISRDRAIVLP